MIVSLSRRRERREAERVTRRAGAQRAEASRGMQRRGGQETHKLPTMRPSWPHPLSMDKAQAQAQAQAEEPPQTD